MQGICNQLESQKHSLERENSVLRRELDDFQEKYSEKARQLEQMELMYKNLKGNTSSSTIINNSYGKESLGDTRIVNHPDASDRGER